MTQDDLDRLDDWTVGDAPELELDGVLRRAEYSAAYCEEGAAGLP